MQKPIRANITLPLYDEEYTIEVNWNVVELVERNFGVIADLVPEMLVTKPMRFQVADVIVEWLAGVQKDYKRREIREAVITSDHDTLQKYVGAIQGAVLYTLRHISEDELQKLTAGQDLEDDQEVEEQVAKKPKRKRSPSSATKSQSASGE